MSVSISSVAASAQQNGATFDFLHLDRDSIFHTLDFLETKDLSCLNHVIHTSKSDVLDCAKAAIETSSRKRCVDEGLPISSAVTWKNLLLKFPNAIGPRFWREYFGEVENVPAIPESFIARAALAGFRLIYIPQYVTIDVGADSALVLDESVAVSGKQARLIEAPERALREPRKIKVPITLWNVVFLTQKYLKENPLSQVKFEGIAPFASTILLDQYGDLGIKRSHWSYQKKEPSHMGIPYYSEQKGETWVKGQTELAQEDSLKVVPLLDRSIFGLSLYAKTGQMFGRYIERISAHTLDNPGSPEQLTIQWFFFEDSNSFSLDLYGKYESYDVGVAVGVPPETP